jgi:manganese-dependent inorganic pyrophosphatase
MRKHDIHAVPIVADNGRLHGVVSERMLARSYLKEMDIYRGKNASFMLGKIAETLNGFLVVGKPDTLIQNSFLIGAMSVESMAQSIVPNDTLILGNRDNAQTIALEAGAACLILTNGILPETAVQKLALEKDAAIIVTPHDTYATTRLINLSLSALQVMESDVLAVSPDTLVKEITQDLLESKLDMALVIDEDGCLLGLLTKSDIIIHRRRRAILVDHSEQSQSIEGIRNAEILEIIDHHRLGGLETAGPILAMIAPVGCTATLILQRYRELGVAPPRAMAGLMLAAILSDTMLLKSPTTTEADKTAVVFLGELLNEDPMEFGIRMYNAKFDIDSLSPDEIATNDMKFFTFGSKHVSISQLEVADKSIVSKHKQAILGALANLQQQRNTDLSLLMVTDIMSEGTELWAVGGLRVVEKAFGQTIQDNAVYLPGVMSRKKQVVPPISRVI